MKNKIEALRAEITAAMEQTATGRALRIFLPYPA